MDALNEIVQQRTSEEVSEWLTTMGSPYNEYAKAFLGEYNPYLVVLVFQPVVDSRRHANAFV